MIIARAHVGAKRGQQVRYRNGDRMDLRRSNLVLVPGPSKHSVPKDGYRAAGASTAVVSDWHRFFANVDDMDQSVLRDTELSPTLKLVAEKRWPDLRQDWSAIPV
jgi:hypothetical protein